MGIGGSSSAIYSEAMKLFESVAASTRIGMENVVSNALY